jgi:hypothetical protein
MVETDSTFTLAGFTTINPSGVRALNQFKDFAARDIYMRFILG